MIIRHQTDCSINETWSNADHYTNHIIYNKSTPSFKALTSKQPTQWMCDFTLMIYPFLTYLDKWYISVVCFAPVFYKTKPNRRISINKCINKYHQPINFKLTLVSKHSESCLVIGRGTFPSPNISNAATKASNSLAQGWGRTRLLIFAMRKSRAVMRKCFIPELIVDIDTIRRYFKYECQCTEMWT